MKSIEFEKPGHKITLTMTGRCILDGKESSFYFYSIDKKDRFYKDDLKRGFKDGMLYVSIPETYIIVPDKDKDRLEEFRKEFETAKKEREKAEKEREKTKIKMVLAYPWTMDYSTCYVEFYLDESDETILENCKKRLINLSKEEFGDAAKQSDEEILGKIQDAKQKKRNFLGRPSAEEVAIKKAIETGEKVLLYKFCIDYNNLIFENTYAYPNGSIRTEREECF